VQISSAMGAGLGQWLVDLPKGSAGVGQTFGYELFLYVVGGAISVQKEKVTQGGYAFLPPGTNYTIKGTAQSSRVLIFRKRYEPLAGYEAPEFFTGHEAGVNEVPFLGDPQARLKTLLPDALGADMAVNIFTYDPGATLPFVETHVMEHGMFFLTGGGVYRLGDDWYPVTAGDAIWIAPYCPQWFIAAGPGPARYIYYKDVNRTPL
jgi:(S)-ureidoglycine aminohydrolase